MGFWTKLKNWWGGEGWKEPTTKEEITPIKREEVPKYADEEVVEIDEITKPREKQKKIEEKEKEEEKIEDVDKIIEETPEEHLTEEGKQRKRQIIERKKKETEEELKIIEQRSEIDKISEQEPLGLPKPTLIKNRPTETQIHETLNKNIDLGRESQIAYFSTGTNYYGTLKDAILGSNIINVDENLADLIVENARRFSNRFTTIMEIYGSQTETGISVVARIAFPGTLMEDVQLANEITEGQTIDKSQGLIKIIQRMQEKLGLQDIPPREHPGFDKNVQVEEIRFGTRFK